ncbi:MAG TPA: hypothetical protein VF173_22145 [Thermoanaerobaculia bacterium]|nr:hypothetical protein [Thermoanaerobaculia bacterium]
MNLRIAKLIAVTFVLCGVVAAGLARADVELPCLPDCTATPWEVPTQEAWLTLPSGCVIQVGYAVRRKACGQFYDIGIKWMSPYNPSDPACNCLNGMPISQLLDMVTKMLLEQNPMGFPPQTPGQCSTNWRVIKGSCWSKQMIDYGGGTLYPTYRPCSQTACCLKPYTVCLDSCGNRSSKNNAYPDYGSCPGAVPPPYGGACEPVCQ